MVLTTTMKSVTATCRLASKQTHLTDSEANNWVIMPLVPYNAFENHSSIGIYKPEPPSLENKHYLGTDTTSRDILARLVYGTRIALLFAVAYMVAVYFIGIAIGCAMGYFGGAFDLLFQRLIEIWSNIPIPCTWLSLFSQSSRRPFSIPTRIAILLIVMVLFSWTRHDLLHENRDV